MRELILKLSHRRFVDIPAVQAKCLHAVRAKMPFCLVRLGDGEGAFLRSKSHSCWDDKLLRDHRKFFAGRWYNDPDLACDKNFLQIADELPTMLSVADIVGVPSADWIRQEIRLRNLSTVINCLQIIRLLEDYEIDESRTSVSSVALDLEYHGLLQEILNESGSVSLITSHAALGDHLSQHRRATIRQTILIPPAHSDCEQTGYQLRSSHFRDSFSVTIKSIKKTIRPGDVVLVAAGFLGKVYALRVRQQGGIALDIGSLADLWMGHMTRPAFRNLRDLQLLKMSS